MSTTVQFRRGTALQNQQFRGAAGEITIDMDNFQLRVHDGVNYGGHVISGGTTGGGGSVTSINVDGGTTGLTFTGGPITSNGTFTMAGRLAVISGGTGTANPVMTSTSPLAITCTWPNVNVALTGTVTVATGGTGISTTPGQNQVLLGDGSKYNLTTIRAGTGVNFDQTNPGVLTINSSGGSGSGTNVTLADLPPGTIQWFAMPAAPAGWLECDGRLLSKVTGSGLYAALWTAIGYTYNQLADGTADNFRIPDLRGQFLRGWDHGAGVDPGRMFGNVQTDDFKSHTHGLNTGQGNGGQGFPVEFQTAWSTNLQGRITATGGTETRPKNVAMLACIKFTSGAAATLVSNVNVSGGITGMEFTGGPVTSAGTITMTGTLAVANGGTGLSKVRPIMMVYAATAATASSPLMGTLGPFTTVKYDTVVVDTDNAFNTATNTFTPRTPGWYRINATVLETATGTSAYTPRIQLFKNNIRYMVNCYLINYPGGYVQTMQLNTLVAMNGTTDSLTVGIATDNGLTITYLIGLDTQMTAEWVCVI